MSEYTDKLFPKGWSKPGTIKLNKYASYTEGERQQTTPTTPTVPQPQTQKTDMWGDIANNIGNAAKWTGESVVNAPKNVTNFAKDVARPVTDTASNIIKYAQSASSQEAYSHVLDAVNQSNKKIQTDLSSGKLTQQQAHDYMKHNQDILNNVSKKANQATKSFSDINPREAAVSAAEIPLMFAGGSAAAGAVGDVAKGGAETVGKSLVKKMAVNAAEQAPIGAAFGAAETARNEKATPKDYLTNIAIGAGSVAALGAIIEPLSLAAKSAFTKASEAMANKLGRKLTTDEAITLAEHAASTEIKPTEVKTEIPKPTVDHNVVRAKVENATGTKLSDEQAIQLAKNTEAKPTVTTELPKAETAPQVTKTEVPQNIKDEISRYSRMSTDQNKAAEMFANDITAKQKISEEMDSTIRRNNSAPGAGGGPVNNYYKGINLSDKEGLIKLFKEQTEAAPIVTKTSELSSTEAKQVLSTEGKPIEAPVEEGNKISGNALRIQQKAVEKKLVDKMSDLPTYRSINMKDQAEQAVKLVNEDKQTAIDIIDGKVQPTGTLKAQSVHQALEDTAMREGDGELLNKLAKSHVNTELSESAQKLRIAAERDPQSPVEQIRQLREERLKSAEKRYRTQFGKELNKTKGIIDRATPRATKQTWTQFIQGLEC